MLSKQYSQHLSCYYHYLATVLHYPSNTFIIYTVPINLHTGIVDFNSLWSYSKVTFFKMIYHVYILKTIMKMYEQDFKKYFQLSTFFALLFEALYLFCHHFFLFQL